MKLEMHTMSLLPGLDIASISSRLSKRFADRRVDYHNIMRLSITRPDRAGDCHHLTPRASSSSV
jgi:hypothetical protein